MIADTIKIKVLSLVSIVAVTALLICSYTLHNQAGVIEDKTAEIATLLTLKELQRDTIQSLKEDLETKPKEYIKIVKEVDRKLCEGVLQGDAIMKLPQTYKQKGELVHETNGQNNVVELDGKLPTDLIELLK